MLFLTVAVAEIDHQMFRQVKLGSVSQAAAISWRGSSAFCRRA
jgi:hypothetical protein